MVLNASVPAEIDVFGPMGYTPHAKQAEFHTLSATRTNAILFGGAAGGGKSAAMMMDAIHNAVNYPGMKIGCIRRTYNELSESFLAELSKRGYARALGAKWNNSDKKLHFPNGSEINFTYAESEQDASRLLGGEYQAFYIDEASRMMSIVIQHIEERLRSGSRGLPVIGLRISTNPGGQSHKYLRDRFIIPTDYGKNIVTDEYGRTTAFIQSKFTDNPYIDQGYEQVLNAIADPQRRAAMRDGDWDAMVGNFFSSWSRARILVPDTQLPTEWQRFAGIDYGYRAPFATIWCAVDNDGRLWAYRELYVTLVDPEHQAIMILDAEKAGHDLEVFRYADPSMWGHVGTPLSIADQYGMAGCGIQKADNDRINGWSRVHAALNDGPACEFHRQLGQDTCPMLHVIDGHCPMFMETMPNLPRSTTKPDDAETKNTDDHLPDAFRYLCMAVGTSARPVIYNSTPTEEAIQRHHETLGAAYNPIDRSTPAGLYAGNLGMTMGSSY